MLQALKASVIAIGVATAMSSGAWADTVNFAATMTGGSEVPPKLTPGKGAATASLDTTTNVLTYTVQYADLTGPATAAHFHGPAADGANAGVVVPFANAASSPISGTANLTPEQAADLTGGRWYANVHTQANPAGEIRGQMLKGTP
jgi:hypothetical protein